MITSGARRIVNVVAVLLAATSLASFAAPRAASGQALLIASHEVRDFEQWKRVFDEAAEIKRRLGWIGSSIHHVDGKPNHVLVIEEFRTGEEARRFAALVELRAGMERAGMIGEPSLRVVVPAKR